MRVVTIGSLIFDVAHGNRHRLGLVTNSPPFCNIGIRNSLRQPLGRLNGQNRSGGCRFTMVNVADAFGIELADAARPAFAEAGFEIVYDTSYPLGSQDLSPVVKGAKESNPDAFVAFSYPPDTFGLTEQAKIEGLNTKVRLIIRRAYGFHSADATLALVMLAAGPINPQLPHDRTHVPAA